MKDSRSSKPVRDSVANFWDSQKWMSWEIDDLWEIDITMVGPTSLVTDALYAHSYLGEDDE